MYAAIVGVISAVAYFVVKSAVKAAIKEFEEEELSDYMKAVNAKVKSMQNYFFKKEDPVKLAEKKKQKEYFERAYSYGCLIRVGVRISDGNRIVVWERWGQSERRLCGRFKRY